MTSQTDRPVQCCRCRNQHQESDRGEKFSQKTGFMNSVCPRCIGTSFYDLTPWYAWCYASGLIEMGPQYPAESADGSGVIVFASGPKSYLEGTITVVARQGHGKSAGKLLVPGVPEAANGNEALNALLEWFCWCSKRNGKRGTNGVLFDNHIHKSDEVDLAEAV